MSFLLSALLFKIIILLISRTLLKNQMVALTVSKFGNTEDWQYFWCSFFSNIICSASNNLKCQVPERIILSYNGQSFEFSKHYKKI